MSTGHAVERPERMQRAPMSVERREFLLAVAGRHAATFDELARRRRGGTGFSTVTRPLAAPRLLPPLPPRALASPHMPSPRKLEVLKLMSEGHTNLEIARLLEISEETVKTYVKGLGHILGSRNRTHTVALAYRTRLLEIDPQTDHDP